MDHGQYVARWSQLHGNYDPARNRLVAFWLAVSYALARPLASARVPPLALTLAAIASAAGAAALAARTATWALAAAVLVVLAGLCDSLDGAIAILTERTSALGTIVDAAADRFADLLMVAALKLAGAPALHCVVAAALMFLHEYVRVQARAVGMHDVGVITVSERPTRIIVTATFLFGYGVYADARWAVLGTWVWIVLGTIGMTQLLIDLRRRLRSA